MSATPRRRSFWLLFDTQLNDALFVQFLAAKKTFPPGVGDLVCEEAMGEPKSILTSRPLGFGEFDAEVPGPKSKGRPRGDSFASRVVMSEIGQGPTNNAIIKQTGQGSNFFNQDINQS